MMKFFQKTCWWMTFAAFSMGLAQAAQAAQAAEARSYTADLATLFNEYQRVLTLRDACIQTQPAKATDIAEAYQDWHARHVRIVDDLDNRFAAMIKRASKNQAEYSKNYGKYQAEVIQLREDNKKALLANKDKLAPQCVDLPGYLKTPKSDIPALFPTEFKTVYRVR